MNRILIAIALAIGFSSGSVDAKPPARNKRILAQEQFEPQQGVKIEIVVPSPKGPTSVKNTYAKRNQAALRGGLAARVASKQNPLFMRAEQFDAAVKTSGKIRTPESEAPLKGKYTLSADSESIVLRDGKGSTLIRIEWPRADQTAPTKAAHELTTAAFSALADANVRSEKFPTKVAWDSERWELHYSDGVKIPLTKDTPTRRETATTATDAATL